MITMEQAGKKFDVDQTYHVKLPATSHIVLVVGTVYGTPAAKFQHPNMLAKQKKVYNLKHYRQGGSKFWTCRIGYDLYFCVPTSKIGMIEEKGYSYVPVDIAGKKMTLNVSGGTADGWTDWVNPTVSLTGIKSTLARCKHIASISITKDEFEALPNRQDFNFFEEDDQKQFDKLRAELDVRASLRPGLKIALTEGCSIRGEKVGGPLTVTQLFPRRRMLFADWWNTSIMVRYRHIDWVETAKLNAAECVNPTKTAAV